MRTKTFLSLALTLFVSFSTWASTDEFVPSAKKANAALVAVHSAPRFMNRNYMTRVFETIAQLPASSIQEDAINSAKDPRLSGLAKGLMMLEFNFLYESQLVENAITKAMNSPKAGATGSEKATAVAAVLSLSLAQGLIELLEAGQNLSDSQKEAIAQLTETRAQQYAQSLQTEIAKALTQ